MAPSVRRGLLLKGKPAQKCHSLSTHLDSSEGQPPGGTGRGRALQADSAGVGSIVASPAFPGERGFSPFPLAGVISEQNPNRLGLFSQSD